MKIKNLALTLLAIAAMNQLALGAEIDTNASAAPTNAPAASASQAVAASTNQVVAAAPDISEPPPAPTTNALRMNFQDVPLNTVLNYLSAKTGYVIVSDVELHGNVTIVSEQPVNTNEIFDLLSGALAKNNYNVVRNGRILTITTSDTAATSGPVKEVIKAEDVPLSDQIATDIIPVHTLAPVQLIKDLEQLIPSGAKLTANEAGNAVIMTGRQKDIHHFVEIVNALDGSSVADVAVFPLDYADAKSVAAELKEIFQSPDSSVARS